MKTTVLVIIIETSIEIKTKFVIMHILPFQLLSSPDLPYEKLVWLLPLWSTCSSIRSESWLQQWKLRQQQKHLSARLHRKSSEHKSFHGIWYDRHSWLPLLSNTLLPPEKWSWECIKKVISMNDLTFPWQLCGLYSMSRIL